ncbi:DUF883 domain-containing protein [Nitrosomonas sp.]|uniref:DUF883 family protein n=1 Tax=Nitrosomonas sp. TaxID=42353 RepID=UPI00260594B2|nr:DUF883 domain-containing protein [Nitrosomonas sp.]
MKNVDTVVDTVTDFTNETVEKASKATNKAIDKASKATQQVADTMSEKGDQLKHAEQRLMKEATDYVRDNPVTSVGIAIGVGFLLSKWFNNR